MGARMTGTDTIEELLDAYRAAVEARDVDALVGLYAGDVTVFDTWRWSYDGGGEWRSNVAEWFGSLGDERVGVEWDDVRTVAGEDLAAVHAVITYKGIAADGRELRAMQNRLTWTLRRLDGAWRIVHEHTSAPADFATMKVSLRR